MLHAIGDRYQAGVSLQGLGVALEAQGRHQQALACWREALSIFQPLGIPEAEEVRALLHAADRSAASRP